MLVKIQDDASEQTAKTLTPPRRCCVSVPKRHIRVNIPRRTQRKCHWAIFYLSSGRLRRYLVVFIGAMGVLNAGAVIVGVKGVSLDDHEYRLVRLCPAEKNKTIQRARVYACHQIHACGVCRNSRHAAMASRCGKSHLPASKLERAETCSGGLARLDALCWQEAPEPIGAEVIRIDAARWTVDRKIVASKNLGSNGIHVSMRPSDILCCSVQVRNSKLASRSRNNGGLLGLAV
jgi:hypothetical protein